MRGLWRQQGDRQQQHGDNAAGEKSVAGLRVMLGHGAGDITSLAEPGLDRAVERAKMAWGGKGG